MKKYTHFHFWHAPWLLGLMLLASAQLGAQQQLQVVTKTVNKTLPWAPGQTLNITADMADITVESYNGNEVGLELKLIAKHPELRVAEFDLLKMNYVASNYGNDLFIRNFVVLSKKDEQPNATLKAVYKLRVPKNCPIVMSNRFGKVEMKNHEAAIDIKADFCAISLQNIRGKTSLETYFGELNAQDLDGTFYCKADRTDLTINKLNGTGSIQSEYGSLNVQPGDGLVGLNIQSRYTNVYCGESSSKFNYALSAENGKIFHPSTMFFKLTKDQTIHQATYFKGDRMAMINISTSFGDITISKKP